MPVITVHGHSHDMPNVSKNHKTHNKASVQKEIFRPVLSLILFDRLINTRYYVTSMHKGTYK